MKINSYWMSLFTAAAGLLSANPTGMETVAGSAEASAQGNVLQVVAKDCSIIQWDSFSIAPGETTQFILPDSASAVLNRVTGREMSELMGALQANGQVYLINPHGILVGADARIDTANFIASTFDLLNEEFIAKADLLFQGDSNASIVNLGTIATQDGSVVLLARHVQNIGTIEAPNGTAALAGGTQILLKPDGNRRVFIQAAEGNFSIDNGGRIAALAVEMQASGNPYAAAVRHDGQIDALGVKTEHGRVLLVAEEGNLDVTGDIRASASGDALATEEFGEIRALAKEIYVTGNALLDVSNANGGGLISLGFEIEEGDARATALVSTETAQLKADALENGHGGNVLMWGSEIHYFGANVSARGGQLSGDGGFVDASTLGLMEPLGLVNTSAPNGSCGTLLYDPTDITIGAADANITTSYNSSTNTLTYNITNPSATTTISATTLGTNLDMNNVSISTASAGTNNGDITISTAVSWTPATTATTLTLFANRDIDIEVAVTAAGSGAMNFTAARDINVGNGAYTASVTAVNGTIALNSNRNINVGAAAATGAATISTSGTGAINITTTNYYDGTSVITLQGSTAASGPASISTSDSGNIIINAAGSIGLFGEGSSGTSSPATIETSSGIGNITINTGVLGSSSATSAGDITLQGASTGAGMGDVGDAAINSGGSVLITMANCNSGLQILGPTSPNNAAAYIDSNGDISITLDGNLTLNGQNQTGSSGSEIYSDNGNVILNVGGNFAFIGGMGTGGDYPYIYSNGTLTAKILGSFTMMSTESGAGPGPLMYVSGSDANALTLTVGGDFSMIANGQDGMQILVDSSGAEVSILGNLIMTSNTSAGGNSSIQWICNNGQSTSETFTLTVGGSVFLTGSTTNNPGAVGISANGGAINLTCMGDLYLTAGVGGSNTSAFIGSGFQSVTGGPIIVSANNIYLNGNASVATGNSAAFIGHGFSGLSITQTAAISVTAQNSIALTGGTGASISFAQIGHMNVSGAGTPQFSGNITVTAGQTITLAGSVNSAFYNAAIGHGYAGTPGMATYPIASTVSVTAGKDIILCSKGSTGGQAIIANYSSQVANAITIICDNNSPTSPAYGASSFLFGPDSLITTASNAGQVSIYTAVRIFNTNTTATSGTNPYFGTINGTTIATAATLGTNTATEKWGVYPSESPSYPGGAFVIYYKRVGGIMINGSVSQTATTPGAPVAVTFTGGVVNYPAGSPEIWISPADISGAQGLANYPTTINAELLSSSTAGSTNSILLSGSAGNIAMPANTNSLTLTAGNDIALMSQITSTTTPAVYIIAGNDCLIGNGTSNYTPSSTTAQLVAQSSGTALLAGSTVNVSTGRDLIELDGIIPGNNAVIWGGDSGTFLQTADLIIGRDLSMFGSGGFASIKAVNIMASIGRNMLQQGGSGSGGVFTEFVSTASMMLSVTGQHTLIGGSGVNGAAADLYCEGTGAHTVGTGLTITGGTGGGNSSTFGASGVIAAQGASYTLTLTRGDLTMTGGVGGPASIYQKSGAGNITINVLNGNISMNGAAGSFNSGSSPAAGNIGSASILYASGASGTLTLNASTTGGGGTLSMTAGAGPGCQALISTASATSGPINIDVEGALSIESGSGRNATSIINAISTMTIEVGGDCAIQGGSGIGAHAYITTEFNSPSTQGISATIGGDLGILGGSGFGLTGIFGAQTSNQTTGVTVIVGNSAAKTGDIVIEGNVGSGLTAIQSNSTLNVTAYGGLTMTGSPSSSRTQPTYIGSDAGGASTAISAAINVNIGQDIVLTGNGINGCWIGSWRSSSGSSTSITSPINVTAGGDITLNGASNGAYSAYLQLAQTSYLNTEITSDLAPSGGFAAIGNVNLNAGSITYAGAIAVTAGGSIILNGGSSASAFAQIGTGGQVKVGYLTATTPGVDTYTPYALSAIGGLNVELITSSAGLAQIVNYGTGSSSSISIVADNLYPTPSGFGSGALIIDSSSIVAAGPLRLYSAIRVQNTISDSTFNGVSFVPGTLGVDTATEQWGFWYPQSFDGVPYTFFYKIVSYPVPTPPPPNEVPASKIDANGLNYLLAANGTLGQFMVRSGGIGARSPSPSTSEEGEE